MKLHRFAAVTLATWSLLLPPFSRTMRLDMSADLSKWNVQSTHATAALCEQERQRLQGLAAPSTPAPKGSLRRVGGEVQAERYRSARCVSSEDPALMQQHKQ
ncbi:MAG TPA: hypothetical protein VMT64_09700 [Candidatus Binataceae bacterium]|nr:hypothetical protein [Candidatus Binataceae bacterium]